MKSIIEKLKKHIDLMGYNLEQGTFAGIVRELERKAAEPLFSDSDEPPISEAHPPMSKTISELLRILDMVASREFEKVGDEGLFPNHTDKDIWISGFKAGVLFANNSDK